MSDQTNKQETPAIVGANEKLNRRRLMKVAIATAPIIATLPTGAALARSSNVITATTNGGARDSQGRTLCLDRTSGVADYGTGIDLGAPARGKLKAIKDRDYRTDDRWSAAQINETDMCKNGGSSYYYSNGWRKVTVPKGMLVSATALSSFAGGINITEV